MPSKTPISAAQTYQEIGEFWDTHDADEFGGQQEAKFSVNIQSQQRYTQA